MTRTRGAQVRFYLDQDIRGAGIVLGGLRADVTYPGDQGAVINKRRRDPSPIQVGALDVNWLPVVGPRGWLVISRDKAIQESISELTAVRDNAVKMVCVTGESASSKWLQLEAIMTYWHRLQELVDRPGPFVFKMSKPGGLREVDIDEALRRLRYGRRRSH